MMAMSRRIFNPDNPAVGQVLPKNAYDDRGQLLLRKGAVIGSSEQLERITENILSLTAPNSLPPPETSFPKNPLGILLAARWRLLELFQQGASDFSAELHRVGGLIARACRANSDLALASVLLVREAPYAVRHAANTAVACQVVGSALEWPEDELRATVAAALTMNIGMLDLQQQLHKMQGPLSDEQRLAIQRHCEVGVDMLRQLGVTDDIWLAAVRDHHERPDGSGYPAGKQGDAISRSARLVSLADVYCARVSSRSYRSALSPTQALRQLFLHEGQSVDESLVAQFIKALGIYPPGTGVRLQNGNVAVVTHRGNAKVNSPRVASITNANGMQLATPLRHNGDSPAHAIKAVVNLDALKLPINMAALWGADAVL